MAEPKLPDELVMAIGRVTVNGAMLESDIVLFLWMTLGLAGPTGARGGQRVQVPSDQFSRAIDDLRKIAKARLRGSLKREFHAYLGESKCVAERRNRVVHGTWRAVPDGLGRYRCQGLRVSPFTGEPVVDFWSPADVSAIADDIHQARELLVPLLPRLHAALPELNRFVHPGPVPATLAAQRPGIA